MTTLLMIKGKTYASPAVLGKNVILVPGDQVDVADDRHVALLLGDTYMDASNNEHHYFVEADSDEALAFLKKRGGGREEAAAPSKAKTKPSRARTRAGSAE